MPAPTTRRLTASGSVFVNANGASTIFTNPNASSVSGTLTGLALSGGGANATNLIGGSLTNPAEFSANSVDQTSSIHLGTDSGFHAGDQVVYITSDPADTPIGGLVNGHIYTILSVTPDGTTIQLADPNNPGQVLTLTPVTSGKGLKATEYLVATTPILNPDYIQAFIRNGSNVHAGQSVSVSSQDTSSISALIQASAMSIGLVGAAVGVSTTNNLIANTVSAYVDHSSVTGPGGINVTTTSNQTVQATTIATALGISLGISNNDAEANSTIDSVIEAYVNAGTLNAGSNAVNVQATSTLTATTIAGGSSGGTASISDMSPTSTLGGTTQAYVGGATTVVASQLDINANSTNSATAAVAMVGVGGITGSGANPLTAVNRDTEAYIASGANVSAGTGTVNVSAAIDLDVRGQCPIESRSALARSQPWMCKSYIGTTDGTDATEAKTWAYIGEGASVSAGNISVTANANNTAIATPDIFAIGGFSGSGATATTVILPDVEAFVGTVPGSTASGTTTTLSAPGGQITVSAMSSNTTISSAQKSGGGGIDVGVLIVNAVVGGLTNAWLGGNIAFSASQFNVFANGNSTSDGSADLSGIGALSGNGASIEVQVVHDVSTYIVGGATVTGSSGALNLQANSTENAIASGGSTSAGPLASLGLSISANVDGSTVADVGQGATVSAGSLSLQARATTRNASVTANVKGFGIAGVAGALVSAEIGGLVAAFTGSSTTLNLPSGLTVQAISAATPTVSVTVGSGGVLSLGRATATGTIDG